MLLGEASRAVDDEVDDVAWTDTRPSRVARARAQRPARGLRIPMAVTAAGEAMSFLRFTASAGGKRIL